MATIENCSCVRVLWSVVVNESLRRLNTFVKGIVCNGEFITMKLVHMYAPPVLFRFTNLRFP